MKNEQLIIDGDQFSNSCLNFTLKEQLENYCLEELIVYLKNAHSKYQNYFIPRTEQLFLHLIKSNIEKPALNILFHLFEKFSASLAVHISLEENTIFKKCETYFEDANFINFNPFHNHQTEEPYLTEIIAYLSKMKVNNTLVYRQLISILTSFNQDLKEHAWIEENILFKKIQNRISQEIKQDLI